MKSLKEDWNFEKSEKTKNAAIVAQKIAPRDLIIFISDEDKKTARAWRNLAQVDFLSPSELLLRDLMAKRLFILDQKSFTELKRQLEK